MYSLRTDGIKIVYFSQEYTYFVIVKYVFAMCTCVCIMAFCILFVWITNTNDHVRLTQAYKEKIINCLNNIPQNHVVRKIFKL